MEKVILGQKVQGELWEFLGRKILRLTNEAEPSIITPPRPHHRLLELHDPGVFHLLSLRFSVSYIILYYAV